jgi:hypothetical protein
MKEAPTRCEAPPDVFFITGKRYEEGCQLSPESFNHGMQLVSLLLNRDKLI